jgi:hypothetical protein
MVIMKILNFTIKKKFFDMILSGEKTEEYREIKPYYWTRLIDNGKMLDVAKEKCLGVFRAYQNNAGDPWELELGFVGSLKYLSDNFDIFKNYDCAKFTNGYRKNSPSFRINLIGITTGFGNPKWGAIPGVQYFILHLGEILSKNN